MKYLTEYFDAEFSALLKEVGAFYAFSGKQFDESSKAGVQYSNLSTGLICPKGKEKYLLDNMYKIVQNAIVKDYEENGIKIIEREYFNHETQISMDYQPALDELKPYMDKYPDIFTMEVIRKIFSECHTKAIENDWF